MGPMCPPGIKDSKEASYGNAMHWIFRYGPDGAGFLSWTIPDRNATASKLVPTICR